MQLELATPTRQLVSTEVDEVVAPGTEGYFGVLPGHAAFLTTISLSSSDSSSMPRMAMMSCRSL